MRQRPARQQEATGNGGGTSLNPATRHWTRDTRRVSNPVGGEWEWEVGVGAGFGLWGLSVNAHLNSTNLP